MSAIMYEALLVELQSTELQIFLNKIEWNFSAQLQSIRSRTTTTTSLASSEYVPLPDVLLAGQELEECWEEEPEQDDKGE